MMNQKRHNERRIRRVHRTRAKVHGTAGRPRLAVFRSLKHISAQLIDDTARQTVSQAGDAEVDAKLKGVARADAVGSLLADRAKAKNITTVVFDRRHYRYHGQVKALAEAARKAGLQF